MPDLVGSGIKRQRLMHEFGSTPHAPSLSLERVKLETSNSVHGYTLAMKKYPQKGRGHGPGTKNWILNPFRKSGMGEARNF